MCTLCDSGTLCCNVNLSSKKRGLYERPSLMKGQNIAHYVNQEKKLSKRIFARFVASLWDLTGYWAPVILVARLAFREALMNEKKTVSWDDALCHSSRQLLIDALERIYQAHGCFMPRNLLPREKYIENSTSPLLCICVDSGQAASSAVAFLCVENSAADKELTKEHYHVRNFRSTIRLHSLSGHSCPQGEALALTLGVRLRETIRFELEDFLKVRKTVYLSDSASSIYQVATRWNLLEPFFANRVREYHSKASYSQLYYVDTHNNPADLISKKFPKKTMQQLLQHPLWTGNSFMRKPFQSWPIKHLTPKSSTNGITGLMPKFKGYSNNPLPSKDTGFLQMNIEPDPFVRQKTQGDSELLFINKLGVAGATSYKRQFVEKALERSGQIIPYFLTKKGIEQNEEQIRQGLGVEHFSELLARHNDIKIALGAVAYILSWLPKYRKTNFVELQSIAQQKLQNQAALLVKKSLQGVRNKAKYVEINGYPFQLHRKLLSSQIPQLSAILSAKTSYGLAVLRHVHNIYHVLDFNRYDAYLQAGFPSYKYKDSRPALQAIENGCPKCARIKAVRIVSPGGPLLPHKFTASPLYFATTGDLLGPYSYYQGRYKYKLWISVFTDDSSGHTSIIPVSYTHLRAHET